MDLAEFLRETKATFSSMGLSKRTSMRSVLDEPVHVAFDELGRLRTTRNGLFDRVTRRDPNEARPLEPLPYKTDPIAVDSLLPPPSFGEECFESVHFQFAEPFIVSELQQEHAIVEYTPILEIEAPDTILPFILSSLQISVDSVRNGVRQTVVGRSRAPVVYPKSDSCGCGHCNGELHPSLKSVEQLDGQTVIRVKIKRGPIEYINCDGGHKPGRMCDNIYVYNNGVEVLSSPLTAADERLRKGLSHFSPCYRARPVLAHWSSMIGRVLRFYLFEVGLKRKTVRSLRLQALLKWVLHVDPPPISAI